MEIYTARIYFIDPHERPVEVHNIPNYTEAESFAIDVCQKGLGHKSEVDGTFVQYPVHMIAKVIFWKGS